MSTYTATVNTAKFKAAVENAGLCTAPKADARPVLSAVHVECTDDELIFRASTSYVLIRQRVGITGKTGKDRWKATLDHKMALDLLKVIGKGQNVLVGADEQGNVTINNVPVGEDTSRYLVETAPDFDRLFTDVEPKQKATERVAFNPAYIGLLAKFKVVDGETGKVDKSIPVQLTFAGDLRPTVAKLPGLEFLIMPVKITDGCWL